MSEKVISETTVTCDACKRVIAPGALVLRVEFERTAARPARSSWRSGRRGYRVRRSRYHEGDICSACAKRPVFAIMKAIAK